MNTFAECKALEALDVPDAVKRVEIDAWGWGRYEDLKKLNISDVLIASLQAYGRRRRNRSPRPR